jgi:tRNA pseudouridine13 synthase
MIGWQELALDPPRRVEPAAGRARLRERFEDFQVDEVLGFEPSGQGEHWLLRVRKCNANSGWVAADLARQAGVRPFEVGYAGLKDRRAVTTQWFTVPARRGGVQDWAGRVGEGYEILEAHRHTRKLPRGALAGNRFTLVLRGFTGSREALERRVAEIAVEGVPNYFGPQRFGRELGNLAVLRGEPVRGERGFAYSAARSLIFNAVLAERLAAGHWNMLLPGERANLEGSNSTFRVEAIDETLRQRLAALDIHPTGPLWGEGESGVTGEVAELESSVASRYPALLELLRADRLASARRPLRMVVRDLALRWLPEADACELQFSLRGGSFATTVVRELVHLDDATGAEEHA